MRVDPRSRPRRWSLLVVAVDAPGRGRRRRSCGDNEGPPQAPAAGAGRPRAGRAARRGAARDVGAEGPRGLFLHAQRHRRGQGAPTAARAARRHGRRRARSSREPDGVTIHFIVSDGKARLPVRFAGSPPTCSAKAAESSPKAASSAATFVADKILAKHDERYMPPQMDNLAGRRANDDRRSRPCRAVARGGAVAAPACCSASAIRAAS